MTMKGRALRAERRAAAALRATADATLHAAPTEDGESCTLCMGRPRTVRNRPCGHALACEACTIASMEPGERGRYRCPTCRGEVEALEFSPAKVGAAKRRRLQMADYAWAAEASATTFASPLEFVQAMRGAEAEVAAAAEGMLERWESEDEEEDDDLNEDESLPADDPDFSIDEQGHAAVPDGLTSIADGAFLGCPSLASISLPDGLTRLGDRAFDHCSSLTSLTLPATLNTIGDGAFAHCTSLNPTAHEAIPIFH